MENRMKKFYLRAFISIYLVLSFIVMVVSGIILYFAPPGRIANWSDWKILFMTKSQWQSIHTIFTFIFVLAIVLHLYFNWKVLMNYIKIKLNEGMKRKFEIISALVLAILIFTLTFLRVPPFQTVMDFGEQLKNSWSTPEVEPPVPHAELMTLPQYSNTIKADLNIITDNLKKKGIYFDTTSSIDKLAEQNNLTPKQFVDKMKIIESSSKIFEGGGYGRKSIEEICNEYGIDPNTALNRLIKNGLDATLDSNIRELAQEFNMRPIEIVRIITENLVD